MKNIALIIIITLGFSCNPVKQDNSNPMIQLTKKRCLGKCPVYDLFIYEDGLVRYNGIENVKKTGRHQFKIADDQLSELQQLFAKAKFQDIEDPEKKGRDFPITQLSFKNKTISFQGTNMTEKVKDIVSKIEEIAGI